MIIDKIFIRLEFLCLPSFLPLSSSRVSVCFREYTLTHPSYYLESLVLEFCLIKKMSPVAALFTMAVEEDQDDDGVDEDEADADGSHPLLGT